MIGKDRDHGQDQWASQFMSLLTCVVVPASGGGGGVQASPAAADKVAGNGIPLRRIPCSRRSVVSGKPMA